MCLEITVLNQHNYLLCHTGMEVCLGAIPVEQTLYHDCLFISWHSVVVFRHTKQNSTLHCVQPMFLHLVPSCTTSMPQVGQARVEGHPVTPVTLLRTTSSQFFNISSGLWQPSLSQWSERGAGPFHFFKHCQQNMYVAPSLAEHSVHSTLRSFRSVLTARDLQPGHCEENDECLFIVNKEI